MLHPTNNSADVRNLVLAALPAEAYERLARSLEPVKLETGKVFHEIGEPIEDAYFINHGIISKVIVLEDGATVEIGVVGREGAIGISALLGAEHSLQRNMVQIAGDAWRIKIAALKAEFNRGGQLQAMLLRFMRSMMAQAAQAAVCNGLHKVEERLARWLLMTSRRLESDKLPLTQEFISHMLGTRRSGVSVAAGMLQKAGLIDYTRGHITILNTEGLEQATCECYWVVKAELDNYLQSLK